MISLKEIEEISNSPHQRIKDNNLVKAVFSFLRNSSRGTQAKRSNLQPKIDVSEDLQKSIIW